MMNKKYNTSKNFINETKIEKSRITHDHWNQLWGVIANQANEIDESLKQLHQLIIGEHQSGTIDEKFAEGLIEYIEKIPRIMASTEPPENPVVGQIWLDINE